MNHLISKHSRHWLLAVFVCASMLTPVAAQSQLSTTLDARPGPTVSAPARSAAALGIDGKLAPGVAPANAGSNPNANPYGLAAIWLQGDWVAKGCLLLLAIMSMASWYALLAKTFALQPDSGQTIGVGVWIAASVCRRSARCRFAITRKPRRAADSCIGHKAWLCVKCRAELALRSNRREHRRTHEDG